MSSGMAADDMSSGRGADDMSSGRDVDDMSSSRGADDMSSGRGVHDMSSGMCANNILSMTDIYVTAAGWRAGNTRLNFVRPGSDPVGTRAGLLRQPGLLW